MEVLDMMPPVAPPPAPMPLAGRKRKADPQDTHNERLSKRLSLLNLEKNGTKMYVTVENPSSTWSPSPQQQQPPVATTTTTTTTTTSSSSSSSAPPPADSLMQLDDNKYKVYIYNIDDELSSSDTEPDDPGRLVFLPDIEKHLRRARVQQLPPSIPPAILPNADGELAGKQLVLYSVPSSLSVPEEQDSVRKAIIEARARSRARTAAAAASTLTPTPTPVPAAPVVPDLDLLPDSPADSLVPDLALGPAPIVTAPPPPPLLPQPQVAGGPPLGAFPVGVPEPAPVPAVAVPLAVGADPDAMEID